jgi:hypothetical protein
MRALVPPGFGDLAQVELDEAAAAMVDLEGWFGRYPYPVLTLVHPPLTAREAGGMEYPTLICTGGDQVSPRLGMRNVEGVTTHELAHQWFYGLMASDEHRHAFLDEGLTTFATARSMGRRYQTGSGFDGFGLSVSHWAYHRSAGAQAWQIGRLDLPTEGFATGSDYGVSVYPKTAVLMETLRRVYGDEAFDAAMTRYTTDFRYGHPGPDDLVDAFRRGAGEDAAAQLSEGIAGGFVDYAVARLERGEPDTKARVILRRRGDLTFPVEITLREADGTEVQRQWDGRGRTHVLVHEGQSPLVSASIDPGLRVLMDRDLSNNHRSFERTLVATRVQAWTATALGVVWTVMAP